MNDALPGPTSRQGVTASVWRHLGRGERRQAPPSHVALAGEGVPAGDQRGPGVRRGTLDARNDLDAELPQQLLRARMRESVREP